MLQLYSIVQIHIYVTLEKDFRSRHGNVYPPCLNKHIYKFPNLRLFADNRDEMLKHRAIKLSI